MFKYRVRVLALVYSTPDKQLSSQHNTGIYYNTEGDDNAADLMLRDFLFISVTTEFYINHYNLLVATV